MSSTSTLISTLVLISILDLDPDLDLESESDSGSASGSASDFDLEFFEVDLDFDFDLVSWAQWNGTQTNDVETALATAVWVQSSSVADTRARVAMIATRVMITEIGVKTYSNTRVRWMGALIDGMEMPAHV